MGYVTFQFGMYCSRMRAMLVPWSEILYWLHGRIVCYVIKIDAFSPHTIVSANTDIIIINNILAAG